MSKAVLGQLIRPFCALARNMQLAALTLPSCSGRGLRCQQSPRASARIAEPACVRCWPCSQWRPLGQVARVRRRRRCGAMRTLAMVNVDFSPALVLGMGFVACGLSLYQLRRIQPELSRDFDVVVSSIAIFSGGILVFQVRMCVCRPCLPPLPSALLNPALRQGWRLDPLLLFCQLLTAGTALGFALEALRLRQQTQAKPVRGCGCCALPHMLCRAASAGT